MSDQRRRLYLVEMTTEGRTFSAVDMTEELQGLMPAARPVVWGAVSGVDAAYRKLRQLSRETEQNATHGDRVHSAHKALAFFRDMFPDRFWDFKRIGGRHPDPAERDTMAGR